MTQEQQDKTVVIAEYDGWELRDYQPVHGRLLFDKHNSCQWLDCMPYSTSDDWIMPVARKVWKELDNTLFADADNTDLLHFIQDFEHSTFQSTADLFDSVYQAIIYLQSINKAK